MTNASSSQPTQNLLRAASQWLPRAVFGDSTPTAAEGGTRKAPPRLSLAQSFGEPGSRSIEPNLSWFQAGR